MDCKICELRQRHFVCEGCLKSHMSPLVSQPHALSNVLSESTIPKAVQALETMNPARILRAQVARLMQSVDEMKEGLARLRKDNTRKRDHLRMMRERMAEQRRMLEVAKLQLPSSSSSAIETTQTTSTLTLKGSDTHATSTSTSTSTPTPPVTTTSPALVALSQSIARARSGLVQELVEVFNVVEVGGRPPIRGKAGTKGIWTIGDLVLPVPGDMRRYLPDHINAVLTHTIRFVTLLTFYLGIKLPFEVVWSQTQSTSSKSSSCGKLGVGQPWIGAVKGVGGDSGGWARWYTKHPLHLSSSAVPSAPPDTNSGGKDHHHSTSLSTDASVISSAPPTSSTQSSFMTGIAMLLYDVCYLAWTQNVDVPLSQAGEVLSNLWGVCYSSELGKKSHESYPLTPAPTPASFPLDFAQLLQVTTANPTRRPRGIAARERYPAIKPFSVGVSDVPSGSPSSSSSGKRNLGKEGVGRGVEVSFPEEEEDGNGNGNGKEDEWHLVDNNAYDV